MAKNLSIEALSYYDLGWSIIPIKGKDKTPLVPWKKYQEQRPDRGVIEKWWTDYPGANIAAIMGEISRVIAIDIDGPKGEVAYKAMFGEIHSTIRQQTGKPGAFHLIFNYPKDGKGKLGNSSKQLEEVDVRGDGGYVLVEPSIHPSGKQYQWVIDPRESPDDLMDLPADVRAHFWPESISKETSKKKDKDPDWASKLLEGVEKGQRDDACTRLAGYYLRVFQGDIEQTEKILELWNSRNRPPLDWKAIKKCVLSISKKQGREELGEQTGAFIKELEKHIYPDGTYKYAVYPRDKEGFFIISSNDLFDQKGFLLRYMEAMDKKLPRLKAKDWDALLNKLLAEVKIVYVNENETSIGVIKDILRAETTRPLMDLSGLLTGRIVCENVNNGNTNQKTMVYFQIRSILDRARIMGEKLTPKEIGQLLRKMGADARVIRVGDRMISGFEMNLERLKG